MTTSRNSRISHLMLVSLALALPACERDWKPKSPSGLFQAEVTSQVATQPPLRGGKVWQVKIHDAKGNLVYAEPESGRPWHLNNYWAWSADDRFWVLDTDVSKFLVCEQENGTWTMRYAAEGESPPEEVRKRIRR